MRANAPTRAAFVTDRKLPTATATTQLNRDVYDRFTTRCAELGTNRGAMIRKLVEDFLATSAP